MEYEKRRIIQLALRWLGQSTEDQLELERCRAQIHGLYMAAVITRCDTLDLIMINRVCEKLWIDDYGLIPKAGVSR